MTQKEKLNNFIHKVSNIECIYISDIMHIISNGLEIISGFPKNRLYLSLPANYESNKDEILIPFHIRGHHQFPAKTIPLCLEEDCLTDYISLTRPFQSTFEARAYNTQKHVLALNYSGSDMEGSSLLGRMLNIESSLIFPIVFNGRNIGVGTIDSAESISKEDFLALLEPIDEFFAGMGSKLAKAKEYYSRIYQEKRFNDVMNQYRIHSYLMKTIQDGMADLSVLLMPQDGIPKDSSGYLIPFSMAAKESNDRIIFEETILHFGGTMDFGSPEFVLTSELMEEDSDIFRPRAEISNTPSLFTFRDMPCRFERELEKRAGLKAGIFYPVVDRRRNLLFAIVLYCKQDTLKKVRKLVSDKKKSSLKDRFKVLESKVNSVFFDLPDFSLVTENLLGIYQVNQQYEEFNRMKDIRRGLTEFLHRILHNIIIMCGADCGTIGIVDNIRDKKYIIIEKEGDVVVGAKSGDIHNTYINPLRVGTKEELLAKELSLPGMAAAYQKTMVITGSEGLDEKGILREPYNNMKSAIATPVMIGNKTIAVIHIGARKRYSFARKTKLILEMISQIVGENIHKLIKKYKVSDEVLRLYGGRYPYIKNDALNYLAELYYNYFLDLSKFLDDTYENYRSRLRDRKEKEDYIILKDVKKAYFDSKLKEINLEEYMEKTDNDIANYIYQKLKSRKASFFDAVQAEYSKHNISRRVAILVFEKAKLAVKKPQITKIAFHLNVCDENYKGNYEEKKKIERFREFYKKTIGITI